MVYAPVVTALLVSFGLNVVPGYRAFVRGEHAWVQAGWALYFFLLPIGGGMLAVGVLVSWFASTHPAWATVSGIGASGSFVVFGAMCAHVFGLFRD